MAGEGERRVEIVVCDKHGLRYNKADGGGCVRCRRESGGVAVHGGGRGPTPVRSGPAETSANAFVQLLLAAALIGGTGALFFSVHQDVVRGFGGMFAEGVEDVAAEGQLEDDGRLSFEEGDAEADTAAFPPEGDSEGDGDTVAFGPAEQERQMNELMRQMQQDAEAEARAAERRARDRADREQ